MSKLKFPAYFNEKALNQLAKSRESWPPSKKSKTLFYIKSCTDNFSSDLKGRTVVYRDKPLKIKTKCAIETFWMKVQKEQDKMSSNIVDKFKTFESLLKELKSINANCPIIKSGISEKEFWDGIKTIGTPQNGGSDFITRKDMDNINDYDYEDDEDDED